MNAYVNADGVLIDPEGAAVARAVGKHNCKGTREMNSDRVAHFKRRVSELGRSPADTVIVLLNVDDANGCVIADMLMPGFNWQEIRDRGEVPFARGLAVKDGIVEALSLFDRDAASELQSASTLSVVVVDHGVAAIFAA
jgi:hypothetical protein